MELNREQAINELDSQINYAKFINSGGVLLSTACAQFVLEQAQYYEAKNERLRAENEKLEAMVNMWKSAAFCEKDRNNSIKADTIHKMKRDLNVEFLYIARCQHDNEPNMTSQEVFDALDRVAKRHLDVSGDDSFTQREKKVEGMREEQYEHKK